MSRKSKQKKSRKPYPMWPDNGKNYVIGYMCLIDFECELGAAAGGNRVYSSIEDLKKHHPSDCGIAEVKIEGIRVVEEGNQ